MSTHSNKLIPGSHKPAPTGGEARDSNSNAVSAAAVDWGVPAKSAVSVAAAAPPAANAAASVNWGAPAPAATAGARAATAGDEPAAQATQASDVPTFFAAPVQSRATIGATAVAPPLSPDMRPVPSAFGGSSNTAANSTALFQMGRKKAPIKKGLAFGGTALGGGGTQKAPGGTSAFDAAERKVAGEEEARKVAGKPQSATQSTQMPPYHNLMPPERHKNKPTGSQDNSAFKDNRAGDNFFSSFNSSGRGGGGGAAAVAPAFGRTGNAKEA